MDGSSLALRPAPRSVTSAARGPPPDLCAIVRAHPGIHFRALQREARVSSAGLFRRQLDRLTREGLLTEVRDGGYSRLFPAHPPGDDLGPLARFSRPLPRAIGRSLLTRPMTRGELRRRLGCADSSLGYHLRRLLEAGDLVRREGAGHEELYALNDEALVRRALGLPEPLSPRA